MPWYEFWGWVAWGAGAVLGLVLSYWIVTLWLRYFG